MTHCEATKQGKGNAKWGWQDGRDLSGWRMAGWSCSCKSGELCGAEAQGGGQGPPHPVLGSSAASQVEDVPELQDGQVAGELSLPAPVCKLS